MIDYDDAKNIGFEWLRTVEDISLLTDNEKKDYDVLRQLDGWSIKTELSGMDSEVVEVCFYVFLPPNYPLSFPIFCLSPKSYDSLKYIPHVNSEKTVCIFNNNAEPNPDKPLEVLKEALYRAKRTIERGIRGEENESAFSEEFYAYWEDQYEKESKTDKSVVLLFDGLLSGDKISVLSIDNLKNGIRYVVYQEEKEILQFKSYLDKYKYHYEESSGLFLGNIDNLNTPPFSLTNREIIKLVSSLSKDKVKAFKKFINSSQYPKLVLFSKKIDNEVKYFGWFHKVIDTNRKGFRPGSLTRYMAISTFSGNINVQRTLPEFLNRKRLIQRSTGKTVEVEQQIYSVVGVGSIGSNLISFLNSNRLNEFRLIDYDTLKIENIGRHLLGFNYLNEHKSLGVKSYLQHISPTQKVTTKESSIFSVVNSTPEYLNESDYVFVALGEANIESWLVNQISKGVLTQPFFFIWVEPYLLGGHCLYLNPSDNTYNNYFNEKKYFEYNIIAESEYIEQNPLLSMKEAGCQTNYTPYSANNVMSFLGQLSTHIFQILNNGELQSKSFTWVGDKKLAKSLKIELSEYANSLNSFTLVKNTML